MQKPVFRVKMETSAGDPIIAGNTIYRLVSQAYTFHIGFGIWSWGLIWNRPVAVTRQIAGGQEEKTPVVDVTRLVQIGILVSGMIGAVMMARVAARHA